MDAIIIHLMHSKLDPETKMQYQTGENASRLSDIRQSAFK